MPRPPEPVPQDLAESVLEHLRKGETLSSWCRDNNVGRTTVHQWRDKDEAFREQYARAKRDGYDAIADSLLDIADDGRNDWMERQGKDGETYTVVDQEAVQRSRVRIDTRKWLLSKWDGPRYGDRQRVDLNAKVDWTEAMEQGRKAAGQVEPGEDCDD